MNLPVRLVLHVAAAAMLVGTACAAEPFYAPRGFQIIGHVKDGNLDVCWTGPVAIAHVGDFQGRRWKNTLPSPLKEGCFTLRGNGRFNLYDESNRALMITPDSSDGLDLALAGNHLCRACNHPNGCALKVVANPQTDRDCDKRNWVPYAGPSEHKESDVRAREQLEIRQVPR